MRPYSPASGAVLRALEVIGDKTSVNTLRAAAKQFFDGEITYEQCVQGRMNWRKKLKVNGDCRTYRTQPRRSMLNDQFIEPDIQRTLDNLSGRNREILKRILQSSHSVSQILNHL